jgi:predicted O-linked N-acetylglucosamine transferase (SPINDLY family)
LKSHLEEAETLAHSLTNKYPELAFVWNALGNIQKKLHKIAEAEMSYNKAILVDENFLEAYVNLGLILTETLKLKNAKDIYEKVIKLKPDFAEAHFGIGKSSELLGEINEAKCAYQKAIEINPPNVIYWLNLGGLYQKEKEHRESEKCLRKALELDPESSEVLNLLSIVVSTTGKLNEAELFCRKAIELDKGNANFYNNLATILRNKGKINEAIETYRIALNLSNNKYSIHSNLIFSLSYADSIKLEQAFDETKKFGLNLFENIGKRYTYWKTKHLNEPLKIGFVSGDLINHPVGYFIENILTYLAVSNVQLFAYTSRSHEDSLTARIKPEFHGWCPIFHLNDRDAAQKIYEDGIHVLIDLSGHTGHNRLPIFGLKPAPVQVSWLGYFASTGVYEMDYLLADETGVLPEHHKYFTEKIWYLPDTRLCFSPPKSESVVSPLPALTNGKITFGNFQTLARINDNVLKLWGEILAAIPFSELRLQSKSLDDITTRLILKERLEKLGIDPLRVIPHQTTDRETYLKSHNEIDIILDSFPYTGVIRQQKTGQKS